MLYFKTRAQARNFAKGDKKIIDRAKTTIDLVEIFKIVSTGKRWAVKI